MVRVNDVNLRKPTFKQSINKRIRNKYKAYNLLESKQVLSKQKWKRLQRNQ